MTRVPSPRQLRRRHQQVNRPDARRRFLRLEQLEDRRLLAVRVWDGGGVDANWSTAANWVGDVAPLTNDELVFPAGAAKLTNMNDLAAGTILTAITFTGAGYDITGANETVLTGGITSNPTAGANSLTSPLRILGNQTIASANPGSTLTLGAVDTGNLFTLSFQGDGEVEIEGTVSGTGGLDKRGTGTLVLSGPNTFGGLTNVVQGVVSVRNSLGLGSTDGATIVGSGAALELQGSISVGAEPLQIAGRGVNGQSDEFNNTGALRSVSGANSWAGGVTLAGTSVIGVDAGSLNISGLISGSTLAANNLYKVGAGTLEFSGTESNTYNGTTFAYEGVLLLNKSGGAVAIANNLTIGDHQGPGTDTVRLAGPEQIAHLDLTGTLNRTLTIRSTGALDLNGQAETIGNLTFERASAASGAVTDLAGAGLLTLEGNILVNSSLAGTSGATPQATISADVNLGSHSRTFTVNDTNLLADAQAAPDLVITGDISGAAGVHLTKAGAGNLSLSGDNSGLLGNLYLTSGFLGIGSNTALGSGTASLNGTVFANGPRTVANDVLLDGTLIVAGTAPLVFSGPVNLTASRTVRIVEAAQTTEFAGGIGEQLGSNNLTFDGAGTAVISAPASVSGTITVGSGSLLTTLSSTTNLSPVASGGNLIVRGDGAIREAAGITVNYDAALVLDNSVDNVADRLGDATITLNKGTFELIGKAGEATREITGSITSNVGHNVIRLTPGGGSVELNPNALTLNQGATVEFTAVGADLGDAAARVRFLNTPGLDDFIFPRSFVSHSGGFDLATYDGEQGVIPFQDYVVDPPDLAALPTTANVLLTASPPALTGDARFNSLVLKGTGITINNGGNELRIDSGTILDTQGGNSFTGGGSLTTGGGNSLNVAVLAGTTTIGTTISATTTGGLTKTGGGTLVLTAANAYAGNTEVGAGVLRIANDGALGVAANGTTVRDGAALEVDGVTVTGETLTLFGQGPTGAGAIRALSNAVWDGNVVLGSNAVALGADGGALLAVNGVISGNSNLFKVGAGALEFGGSAANTYTNGTAYVLDGTLRFAKNPGVNAIVSNIVVGDDAGGAASAVLELGASDQIPNGQIVINSDGRLDLGGNSDVVGQLFLRSGVGKAASIVGAGLLTPSSNVNLQALPGANATAVIASDLVLTANRSFVVDDTSAAVDLSVTGEISQSGGARALTKLGLGTLELGGSVSNTFTGTTNVAEGTLRLNKTGGAEPFGSVAVVIGEGGISTSNASGVNADRLVLATDDQIPDGATVTVNATGQFDLGGNNESINALTVAGGNVTTGGGDLALLFVGNQLVMTGGMIDTGAGSLVLSSNILTNGTAFPATIAGNIDLGGATRTFTVNNGGNVAIDAIFAADIHNGGLLYTGNGGEALFSGDNDFAGGLTQSQNFLLLGSNTGLGAGSYAHNAGQLQPFGAARTVANPITLGTTLTVNGFNNLTLSDPAGVQMTANRIFNVLNVGAVVTIAGPVTQDATNRTLTKSGRGVLYLPNDNTYVGATSISNSGGVLILEGSNATTGTTTVGEFSTLILRDDGELDTSTALTVNFGGTLQVENTAVDNPDRLNSVTLTLNFGKFEFQANAAGSSETIGQLSIQGDLDSTVHLVNNGPGASTINSTSSLNLGGRSAVTFRGTGAEIGAGSNDIIFTTAPTLTGGIVARARIVDSSGLDFVTRPVSAPFVIQAAPFNNDINAGGNVKLTGAGGEITALAGDVGINALLLANGVDITEVGGPRTLAVASGFIGVEGGDSDISVGTLQFGTLATPNVNGVLVTNSSLTLDAIVHTTNAESLSKTGLGTAILEGANTFTGRVRVTQGGLVVRNDGALGTADGLAGTETVVNNRTFLLLDGARTIGDERLTITGNGLYNDQTGSLRATGGNSAWGTGATVLNRGGSTNSIAVDEGRTLILDTEIGGGGNSLNVLGGGTLEFTGTTGNTYTGQTNVNQGTLRLNKVGNVAVNGSLVVGDGFGGDNADRVVLLANDQINSTANRTVTINHSGQLDLNGANQTLLNEAANGNVLVVNVGPVYSGDVTLGGGMLTLQRNLTANGSPLVVGVTGTVGTSTTSSPAASIVNGMLILSGANANVNVGDAGPVQDLVLSATVSAPLLNKIGAGGLNLAADNAATLGSVRHAGGTVILGHNSALGSGPLDLAVANVILQGDDDVSLRTIGNDLLLSLNAAQTIIFGNFQGLAPLTFTGAITNNQTQNRVFTLQNSATRFEGDFDNNGRVLTLNTVGSLTTTAGNVTTYAGSLNNLTNLTANGVGYGTLILAGANNQSGITTVNQGIVRVQHAGALGASGSSTNDTLISNNAVLELDGVSIGDEYLRIGTTTGFVETDDPTIPASQALRGRGSLRNISGNNTWGTGATVIRLNANPSDVYVDNATSLTLNGEVIGSGTAATGANALVKIGDGTLTLAGNGANNYTGQTSVLEGTLVLNKPDNTNALGSTLVVGDGQGTDTVRWAANEQMPNVTVITHISGVLNLDGFTESIGAPVFGIGPSSSGTVINGGTLITAGTLTIPVDARALSGGPAPVSINANYDLGTANREFRVPDSAAAEELVINGEISDSGGARGVNKTGYGAARYAGAAPNTYDGTTTVSAGTLILGKGLNVTAFAGALTVGNGIGEQDDDQLISLFSGQFSGVGTTTVNTAGYLNLAQANVSDTVNAVTTEAGTRTGGRINTGMGTLTVLGNVTVNADGTGETSARLEGLVDLDGGTRTFTVNTRQAALDTRDEFQVIDLDGATGGTFTLSYLEHVTAPLVFNATPAAVEGALRGLNTITGTSVSVQSPADGKYYVFFRDGLGKADVATLEIDDALLTGAGTPAVSVRHEGIETVELDASALIDNGNLTKAGAGAIRLSGANTHGNTSLTAGFLLLASNSDAGLTMGPVGTGTLTISGTSELRADGIARTLHNPITLSTTLQATGANDLTLLSATPLTLTANRSLFVADPAMTVNMATVVTGNAGGRQLTKTGAGELQLNEDNTYTGSTNVNAGTLAGIGSIDGPLAVNNLATFRPGTSPGVFTVTGNVAFNAGSTFFVEIDGATPGNGAGRHAQLVVNGTGTVTINATAVLDGDSTAALPVGTQIIVIDKQSAGAISGEFANAVSPSPPALVTLGTRPYTFDYANASPGDGNDFVLGSAAVALSWDGEGVDDLWSNPVNWVGDVLPASGDSALFGDAGNTRETNDNDLVGYEFSSITFNKTVGAPYDLVGEAVMLSAAGGGVTQAATNVASNSISLDSLLTSVEDQTISNLAAAATLTINSPIALMLDGDLIVDGAGDTVFTGNVTGTEELTKNGLGTLTFDTTSASTYMGPTTVNAGTLVVDGSIDSDVLVNGSGTLNGSGTITGDVSGAGMFSPGNSPGVMTIIGNFTPSGTVDFEVNSNWTIPGTEFDRYNVTGMVDLTGATVTFSNASDTPAPGIGSVIKLIDNDTAGDMTMPAATPAEGATVMIGTRLFKLFYNGGDGNDVVLVEATTPTVVYVDDAWAGLPNGTQIPDGDDGTAAPELAVVGVNAFALPSAAVAAVDIGGTVIVNDGSYGGDAVDLAAASNKTLQLTGKAMGTMTSTVTIGSIDSALGTTLALDDNLLVLSNGDASPTNTLAGDLTGTGGLTKQGADTVVIPADNTAGYSGTTTIAAGILQVTDVGALGTGPVSLDGGDLALDPTVASPTGGLRGDLYELAPLGDVLSLGGSGWSRVNSLTALNNLLLETQAGHVGIAGTLAIANNNGFPFDDLAMVPAAPTSLGNDNVAAVFRGEVFLAATGTHTFTTNGNSGSLVFIDGNLVVNDNLVDDAFTNNQRTGPFNNAVANTWHEIVIVYYEVGGNSAWQLAYDLPGGATTYVAIPAADLRAPALAGLNFGNDISVAAGANSTVMLQGDGTTFAFDNLSLGAGATLNVSSVASDSDAPQTLQFNSTTLTDDATLAPDARGEIRLGLVSDGAAIGIDLELGGPGKVIFDHLAASGDLNGTTLNVTDGWLSGVRSNIGGSTGNPLNGAVINLNGGDLALQNRQDGTASVAFANVINVQQDATIAKSGAQQVDLQQAINVGAGLTLTLDVLTGTLRKGTTGLISGAGITLNKVGPGGFATNQNHTFTGTVNVQQGTYFFEASVPAAAASPLGNGATINLGETTGRAGAALRSNNGSGTLTFVRPINVLAGSTGGATIGTNNSAGSVNFQGGINLAKSVTFDNANTTAGQTMTVSGVIDDGAGTFGVTKTGNGVLVLPTGNSYDGTTNLSAGTTAIGHNDAFGTGLLQIGSATLRSTAATPAGDHTIPNAVQFTGNPTIGDGTANGVLTFTGAGTLTGNRTFNIPSTVIYNGAIGQSGGNRNLEKNGGGTFVLGGANTFQGLLSVRNGVVVAANDGALGTGAGATFVADGATLAFQGGVSVAEAVTVAGLGETGQTGAILNLADDNIYTGTLTAVDVSQGEIRIGSDAGSLTLNGTLDLNFSGLSVDGAGDVVINSNIIGVGMSQTFNALRQTWYTGTFNNTHVDNVGGGGGFLALTPAGETRRTGHLDFDNDGQFQGATTNPNRLTAGDNYGFVWEGDLNISNGGAGLNVAFRLGADSAGVDDRANVFVDGVSRVSSGVSGSAVVGGSFFLADGSHPLAIAYREGTGTAKMSVEISLDGGGTWQDLNAGALGGLVTVTYDADNFLAKTGTGTLTIGAASNSTINGATTVSDGTLLVNGTLSDTTSVTVDDTAGGAPTTLGGTGTINPAATVTVNAGAQLAPGTSPGVLNTGSLDLATGSTYVVELGGTTPGNTPTDHDQDNVTGSVSLDATLSVSLFGGFTPDPNVLQEFIIINNDLADPVTGMFAGLGEGAEITVGGSKLYLSYFADSATSGAGNDVALYSQPVINGTPGVDVVTVTLADAMGNITVTYSLNGGAITGSMTTTTPPQAFSFSGGDDDDTLNVMLNGFSGLPLGITFDGEGQATPSGSGGNPQFGDVLHLEGTGTQTASYIGDSATPGAGTIDATGLGTISFTGLEPVNMFNLAVANVDFPNADDVISLDAGFGATVPTLGDAALVVSGLSGGVAFESVHLRNNALVNIDTVANGSDGDDTVTINGGVNAHGNVDLVIDTGSGLDAVNVPASLTVSGDIDIASQNINFTGGTLSAGGTNTITLNAGAGAITTSTAAVDVVAQTLDATAEDGIDLDTTVEDITAVTGGAGAIVLDETDDVTLTLIVAFDGPITITAGADVAAVFVQTLTDADANDVHITADTGDLTVTSVLAGAGVAGDVTLEATLGSILDDGVNGTGITADALTLTALFAIGQPGPVEQIDAFANTLDASTTDTTGPAPPPMLGIWLAEVFNDLELVDVDTQIGVIVIDAAGGLIATDVEAGAFLAAPGNGNIRLRALNGDLAVGSVTAVGDVVNLSASAAITDGDAGNDVTALGLRLTAGTGIGSGADPLDTTVSELTYDSGSGSIDLENTGGLTLTNTVTFIDPAQLLAGAGGGYATITALSPLTIAADVSMGGAILYTATESAGTGDDLTVNAGVSVESTGSSVTLRGGDDVLLDVGSSVAAATTVLIQGDFGNADGAGTTISVFGDVDGTSITLEGNSDADTFLVDDDGGDATSGTTAGLLAATTVLGAGGDDSLTLVDSTAGAALVITVTETGGAAETSTISGISGAMVSLDDVEDVAIDTDTPFSDEYNLIFDADGVDSVYTFNADRDPPVATANNDKLNISGVITLPLVFFSAENGSLTLPEGSVNWTEFECFTINGSNNFPLNTLYIEGEDDTAGSPNNRDRIIISSASPPGPYGSVWVSFDISTAWGETGGQKYGPYAFDLSDLVNLPPRIVVYGNSGDDDIQVAGNVPAEISAELHGEEGNDYIAGGRGNDLLVGGAGNDKLLAGEGNNVVWGDVEGVRDGSVGDGNDTIDTRSGDDVAFGGGGNDTISTSFGNDYLHGGDGNDMLSAGDGDDILRGGAGNDTLDGSDGDDILVGDNNEGADDGVDRIFGRRGLDIMIGSGGADWVQDDDGASADILIAGTTVYDADDGPISATDLRANNDLALLSILALWQANVPAATLANVTAGATAINGSANSLLPTTDVNDDGVRDTVISVVGATASDWILANLALDRLINTDANDLKDDVT